MPDREKVIKGLNNIGREIVNTIGHGEAVPYLRTIDEAVALLKEQEAVEPIKKEMVEITARYEFDCPCGAPLLIGQPYCADCGRSVKWG